MFQQLTLIGNLGITPELRVTKSGTPVTSFFLATNRKYTSNSGEKISETCWFKVTVWGEKAESCVKYLTKGSKVLVQGILTPDENTGNPRIKVYPDGNYSSQYEVTADSIQFLDSKEDIEYLLKLISISQFDDRIMENKK